MSHKCKEIKENGETCGAWAMGESDYCYLHNPDIAEAEKKEAQARGGQANGLTILEPQQAVELKTASDIVGLIGDTINKVRAGKLDIKRANCIGFLSGHIIKAIETAELETRLAFIERLIGRGRN
jgi:hypothetical protein